jgi:hypothetical protein
MPWGKNSKVCISVIKGQLITLWTHNKTWCQSGVWYGWLRKMCHICLNTTYFSDIISVQVKVQTALKSAAIHIPGQVLIPHIYSFLVKFDALY